MKTERAPITPAELRSKIAVRNIPKYIIAARARIHPVRLSALLHGRTPVDQQLAERILRALDEK